MVKTEKEFSEIFAGSCKCDESASLFVKELSTHYWTDLTSHLNRYFSNEDRVRITQKAAEVLSQNLQKSTPDEAWKDVIRSFIAPGNWGFLSQEKKPALERTEEQKIFWKFFKYASVCFSSCQRLSFRFR